MPCPFSFGALPCPYRICICSAGRAASIQNDTLKVLGRDGSISPSIVTLCVKQSEAEQYQRHGFYTIAVRDAFGLPEQRALCTEGLLHGSWVLFMDDDVTSVSMPDGMTLNQLILYCFLETRKRNSLLFGLNVSQNERHLRENVSCACGLVAGYFHGIITSDVQGMTRISDRTGGAAEGIERSLRYYKLSGICRFNFATCLARNGTNKGGLQDHFGNNCSRSAAHSYVVQMLAQEFPDLIEFDAAKTNKCTFLALRSEPRAYEHICVECGKTYNRKHDLVHHMTWAHNEGDSELIECPKCRKPFKSKKAMMAHLKAETCYSNRGRPYDHQPTTQVV